jgi:hypothetical protein
LEIKLFGNKMSFTQLPIELVEEIIRELTPLEILSQCNISKKTATLCRNEKFWLRYLETVYGITKTLPDTTAKETALLVDNVLQIAKQGKYYIPVDLFRYIIEHLESKDDLKGIIKSFDISDINQMKYNISATLTPFKTKYINIYKNALESINKKYVEDLNQKFNQIKKYNGTKYRVFDILNDKIETIYARMNQSEKDFFQTFIEYATKKTKYYDAKTSKNKIITLPFDPTFYQSITNNDDFDDFYMDIMSDIKLRVTESLNQ